MRSSALPTTRVTGSIKKVGNRYHCHLAITTKHGKLRERETHSKFFRTQKEAMDFSHRAVNDHFDAIMTPSMLWAILNGNLKIEKNNRR